MDSFPGSSIPRADELLLVHAVALHGDRVSIILNEQLRQPVRIDSSRFHLVLNDAAM